jgi:hypothetical protein
MDKQSKTNKTSSDQHSRKQEDANEVDMSAGGYDESSVRGDAGADAPRTALDGAIDPGLTDLGDDVSRGAGNRDGTLDDHTAQGMEGGIDPALTDLGDDVHKPMTSRGASVGSRNSKGGIEGGIDPRLTDLGDDVYRSPSER